MDGHSATDYVAFPKPIDLRRRDLTVQKISNLIRLALLSSYGGVWSDASVFCNRPLGQWLEEYYGSHFFEFRKSGDDRLLANWFLAAEPDSIILQRLYRRLITYFADNFFSNQGTRWGKMLVKRFNLQWSVDYRTTGRWLSWFARKVLRVYPYYIFHYIFNDLILTDPECAALWSQAKPFPGGQTQRIQSLLQSEGGILEANREIESRIAPMYKLNWRVDSSSTFWTAVLKNYHEQAK